MRSAFLSGRHEQVRSANVNELYALAVGGDKKAEGSLLENLSARFMYLTKQRVRDEADCQELVQESLMVVAKKYGDIEVEVSFAAWAYRIIELRILMYYRDKGRRAERMNQLTDEIQAHPAAVSDPGLRASLLDCLRKLHRVNRKHARIVNLVYQGYKVEEICDRMKLTKTNSYTILSRARAALRDCLENGDLRQ